MKFCLVLGIILVFLFLLSLIRVGGDLEYGVPGLHIRLRFGRFHFTLYPMKPKKEKPEKKKKQKERSKPAEAPQKPKEKTNPWEIIKEFMPVVSDAAGRFKRKVRIDRLDMDLTVAAGDPATAAIAYGAANGFLGMMIPILENNFIIKERRLRTRVDFDSKSPTVWLAAAFSLTIGQGMALSLHIGVRALKTYLSYRDSVQKQKEAV